MHTRNIQLQFHLFKLEFPFSRSGSRRDSCLFQRDPVNIIGRVCLLLTSFRSRPRAFTVSASILQQHFPWSRIRDPDAPLVFPERLKSTSDGQPLKLSCTPMQWCVKRSTVFSYCRSLLIMREDQKISAPNFPQCILTCLKDVSRLSCNWL